MIECLVNNRVCIKDLPDWAKAHIRETLSIDNPERENAKRQKIYGWFNIPEKIELYAQNGDDLLVPRGVLCDLQDYFEHYKIDVDYNTDGVVAVSAQIPPIRHNLRPHQLVASQEICDRAVGIYEAPPGSGKTVTALAAISQVKQRSLIIVNTTNIASQWADRCETFLGFRPGIIGDGQWDESRPITIALNQTLASRIPTLSEDWFKSWGFVCLDECHHVTAGTFFDVMNAFPARWRVGVSATPDRDNGLLGVAYSVLGPVIHKTEKQQLIDDGYLTKPSVVRVQTSFSYNYWSTHYADSSCSIANCEKSGRHRHQNNYQQMLSALVEDEDRNRLIAERVRKNYDCANLVLSKRLSHLHSLRNEVMKFGVFDPTRLFMLTGKEDTEERMRVAREAESGQCVVFSTIADEALDVPRLDKLYLVWPTKNSAVIRQQVGRIERVHPNKKSATVYDFVDANVQPLYKQWIKRGIDVYSSENLVIHT
jgi:superfamily II DNA or RNA helicase